MVLVDVEGRMVDLLIGVAMVVVDTEDLLPTWAAEEGTSTLRT